MYIKFPYAHIAESFLVKKNFSVQLSLNWFKNRDNNNQKENLNIGVSLHINNECKISHVLTITKMIAIRSKLVNIQTIFLCNNTVRFTL